MLSLIAIVKNDRKIAITTIDNKNKKREKYILLLSNFALRNETRIDNSHT